MSPSNTVNYRYDGLGRRVEKEVIAGTTTTTRYVYDNEDILLELDGSNNVTARYTHGPGIDEPLIMEKSSQSFYYHADGLGSITEITNQSGTVVQRYTYSSFGKIESLLDPNFVQPYTFTAREFDPETGLHFYRARYNDVYTGRFLEEDPIGFASGINFYIYAFNNPVLFKDVFGLDIWVEGPTGNEPSGHISINVGDPVRGYSSYSFGINGNGLLGGEVYRDTSLGGDYYPGYYLQTSAAEDALAKAYLDSLVGNQGTYYPWNTCRTFTFKEFDKFRTRGYGKPIIPQPRPRPPSAGSYNVPTSLSSTASDPVRSSSTGSSSPVSTYRR